MTFASYRTIFLEILSELCDLTRSDTVDCEIRWHADFISRTSNWYRFRGAGIPGEMSAEARVLDVHTGNVRSIPAALLTFVLLDFERNEAIAAYNGPTVPPAVIAESLRRADGKMPEIVAVWIQKRRIEDGRLLNIATSIVFVGYARNADVHEFTQRLPLSPTSEIVSPNWFRDRTMVIEHIPERV